MCNGEKRINSIPVVATALCRRGANAMNASTQRGGYECGIVATALCRRAGGNAVNASTQRGGYRVALQPTALRFAVPGRNAMQRLDGARRLQRIKRSATREVCLIIRARRA